MHMLDDHENDASSRCMIAMLVSDPEGYTKTHSFCWPNQNPKLTQYSGREKMDCRGIAYTYQDTSALLVAQTYGCSTHEALDPVAAPLVSDRHHDMVKI